MRLASTASLFLLQPLMSRTYPVRVLSLPHTQVGVNLKGVKTAAACNADYFVQVRPAPDRIWIRDRGCITFPIQLVLFYQKKQSGTNFLVLFFEYGTLSTNYFFLLNRDCCVIHVLG